METYIASLMITHHQYLGNPNAEFTLVEFGDYQCHFCNVYFDNTENKIFENYVETGKVNVFKDYI